MGTELKVVIATIFLCGLTLAGFMALNVGDEESSSLPTFVMPVAGGHTPTLAEAPYKGAVYAGDRGTDMPRLASVSRSVRGANHVTYYSQPSRSDFYRSTSGTLSISSSSWSGAVSGGSGYDAPGTLVTGSVTATSSGGGMLAVQSVSLPSLNHGGGRAGVISPVTPTVPGLPMGSIINQGSDLTVYDGDAPGEITGAENQVLDDPIINCYGLPVGDSYWPFIFFSLLYMSYLLLQKRRVIVTTTQTLVSNGKTILHNPHNITYVMKPIIQHIHIRSKRTAACLLALVALLFWGATSAWAGQEEQNGKTYNVVYLKSGGSGNGDSRDTPLGSWSAAYAKLINTGNRDYDWEHNIIVIVGNMQINYKEGDTKDKSSQQGTAATITGVWPWDASDKATTTQIKNGGKGQINSISCNIGADTRFRNLCIQGTSTADQNRISLRLHSALFDEGLVMIDYKALGDSYGMIVGRNAPALHIQLSFDHDGSGRASDVIYEMPGNSAMTVTFRSGRYGRVAVSRSQGTTQTAVEAAYIQGTPEKPVMAHIIVDIQDGNDNTGSYADDIGILLGGSSQGIVCADLQFDIKRGTIGTLVAGAQGNNISGIEGWKIPQGTFAGRSIINLESDDITIQNLYVGTQGRTQSKGANGTAYFYGLATLNMWGGTVEKGVFASAAAFSGLGNDTYHTPDYAIPYVDNNNVLTFGSYDKNKTMATIKSTYHGNVDLTETVFTMNIYGGTIKSGLCGGSRGYDSFVKTNYAPGGAGSHYGNTNINIYGGTITGGVYGGGLGVSDYYENKDRTGKAEQEKFLTVAQVFGNTNVNIYGGNISGGIYGGGKGVAASSANEYTDIAKVYGNTNVKINPQTLKSRAEWTDPEVPEFTGSNNDWTYTGNIYGGGAMGAVTGNTNVQILGGNITGNVYAASAGETGHADKGKIGGDPSATIAGGTISQNVYGGGQLAPVEGNPSITLAGGAISQDIYGGGDEAPVTGNPLVEAQFGSVNDIFAGGRGATAIVTGNPKAYINKTDNETLTVRDVYGGGDAANVVGTANVQLDKGTVATVYGGGNAANVTNTDVVINGGQATMAFAGGHGDKDAAPQKEANVTGSAHLTIHGGTVAKAFAGSNSKGSIAGAQTLLINKTGDALAELHVTEAYGGGNQADGKAGTIEVGCTGGETEGVGDLFGGAREANISGNIALTLEAGRIARVFGGNNVSGTVAGTITVDIAEDLEKCAGGLHIGSVYGGGQDAAYTAPAPGTYPVVNIQGGSITNDVFGGGLGVTAVVTGSPVVTVNGGTVSGSVYGGGALANVTGNTTVNLTGGTIGNSYGGGLGSNEVAALVAGNASTTLNGSVVEGSIFGANNVNGTPQGHVKVHVLWTQKRAIKDSDPVAYEPYDVAAVYGGGNQAAYVPSQATFDVNKGYAEVLIENCSNSIDYVYGGGNAAPVPATSVTIYGANAINNAFAGGNGAGAGNPGADVGYNGYYSQTAGETPTYGSGKSHITVYGGTVNNVYGGSNTLGYIRTHAYVDIMTPDGGASCPLHVGNTYAGGNQAAMICGGSMTLACSEGADVVYAGANSADIYGDIDLVINSGTYGKVFGGNNIRGNVYGHININIDETGCYPIMIGELYGGGNEAAYSVYGYTNEGPRTKAQYDAMTSDEKTAAGVPYTDPTINIISFTGIGRVFGGGKGERAVVYGNPTIQINPIKGKFAGQHPKPLFVLNNSYERIPNDDELNIPDEVGKIAAVYGGGNAAAVHGNTTVNIGNLAQNNHLNAEPGAEPEDVDAIIAGNIYGGGSQADINGNTHVNIQIGTVLGNVYGGGEGVADDATKAKVTGTTKVTIGE